MSARGSLHEWVSSWWRGDAGLNGRLASFLALPMEAAFRAGSGARNRLYDRKLLVVGRVPVPVVSVGNITLGGTGKTPMAAWVARTLRDHGRRPCILLRGYGMDEVAVHRELNPAVPVATGKDRIDAAADAIAQGADCLILDDGFQHRRLHRDVDIVLVSAEQWRGKQRLLPRGPWREPPSALTRATFLVVTRKSASQAEAEGVLRTAGRYLPDRSTALVHLAITSFEPLDATDERVAIKGGDELVAVSSLANPEAFENQLRETGGVVHPFRFPDHHAFTSADVEAIVGMAHGARIVMTRKEAVKLRGRIPPGIGALVANQGILFERGGAELREAILGAVS